MKKLMLPIFAATAVSSISSQLLLNVNNQSVSSKMNLNQQEIDTAIRLNYARAIFNKYSQQFSQEKAGLSTLLQLFNEKWEKITTRDVLPTDLKEKEEFLNVALNFLNGSNKELTTIIDFKTKHLSLQPQVIKDKTVEELEAFRANIQSHLEQLNPEFLNIDAQLSYILIAKSDINDRTVIDLLDAIYQHNSRKFLEFNLPNDIKIPEYTYSVALSDEQEYQQLEDAKAIFQSFADQYRNDQASVQTAKTNFNEVWKKDLTLKDLKDLSEADKENYIALAVNYLNEMSSKWNNISTLKTIHISLLPQEIRDLTTEKIDAVKSEITHHIGEVSNAHKNLLAKLTYILSEIQDFNTKADNLVSNMQLIENHNQFKFENFDN